ncbi:hypothetical protein BDF14DRAFT_61732 [Spinellus fusiger]|nr:hypothetical protein BDF14DRAFT_61732 [Spinellus fusiger]
MDYSSFSLEHSYLNHLYDEIERNSRVPTHTPVFFDRPLDTIKSSLLERTNKNCASIWTPESSIYSDIFSVPFYQPLLPPTKVLDGINDDSLPMRCLTISVFRQHVNVDLLIHMIKKSGDTKAFYFDHFASYGYFSVSFYNISHAVQCYQDIHRYLATANHEKLATITYVSESQLSQFYNMLPSEISHPSILVTSYSTYNALDNSNYSVRFSYFIGIISSAIHSVLLFYYLQFYHLQFYHLQFYYSIISC